jgi:signal recognition particle GTPase
VRAYVNVSGMGDVVSLVESTRAIWGRKQENSKEIAKNEFGFDDFFHKFSKLKKWVTWKT